MPHFLIHSLEVGPVEHIISPMVLRPSSLTLEADMMHALHDKLAHTIVEHLALDFAIDHLPLKLPHLLASTKRHLQGEEVNEIVFQWIDLQIPRHDRARRFRNHHLPRLAKLVQHFEIILGFRQVLVGLIVHLFVEFHCVLPGEGKFLVEISEVS